MSVTEIHIISTLPMSQYSMMNAWGRLRFEFIMYYHRHNLSDYGLIQDLGSGSLFTTSIIAVSPLSIEISDTFNAIEFRKKIQQISRSIMKIRKLTLSNCK
eukprot:scaffold129149_cov36-Cyclotella_meneghiniana.AAC.1